MKMQVKYNYIYEKLVTANDDVLGLIAYGIYKQHKIEFITKIKEEQHRDPTEEECKLVLYCLDNGEPIDKLP